ncbi:MAG: enoyl-CoA hydratase-related protein [Candidatus Muirbacterium halophilum]|nr:enoyl-CoA hydratase-related protein [Candidatus Muirbacterium halophilum]MCK9475131.1 enoyl-CoA hydratase-related protein [Candidatus Muirbacterium halophilum]
MSYKFFVLEKDNNIYRLIINAPKSLNSLSTELLNDFEKIIDEISKENVKVLIITGIEKSFVAGADIAEMKEMNYQQALDYAKLGHRVFSKIEQAPFITIAAINGYALGGGLELALACDIRIASKRAKLGQPEVSLGIIPGFGATQRLSRLIGVSLAKYVIFSGDTLKAEEAEKMGIVVKVTEPEELIDEAKKIALNIISKSFNAVIIAKKAIEQGIEMPKYEALKTEEILFASCFTHNDQKNGMSAFIERKKPNFE